MLNESKGNMYDFVTHTWNPIKGACHHMCSYCYMKRWGKQKPVRLDEKDLNTYHKGGNFIFVGSSCDMWAKDIPDEWISRVLEKCTIFNRYFFQSKNPARFLDFTKELPNASVYCTTLETNRHYLDTMMLAPPPLARVKAMMKVTQVKPVYITIEPIMKFDLIEFTQMIKACDPKQVNIGADSQKSGLPEPTGNEVKELIEALSEFTVVHQKSNLKRIISN